MAIGDRITVNDEVREAAAEFFEEHDALQHTMREMSQVARKSLLQGWAVLHEALAGRLDDARVYDYDREAGTLSDVGPKTWDELVGVHERARARRRQALAGLGFDVAVARAGAEQAEGVQNPPSEAQP